MKKILLLFFILASTPAIAGYNANIQGKITNLLTYPNSTLILFKLDTQPSTHPTCTQLDFFAIDPSISNESRQLVMSRLMLAYSTKEIINIGYDKEGGLR